MCWLYISNSIIKNKNIFIKVTNKIGNGGINFSNLNYFDNFFSSKFNFFNKLLTKISDFRWNNFYISNNFNFKIFKKIINIIFQISTEKKNFVVLDSNYKHILPIYNFSFGLKNLFKFKNYFFLKKNSLSQWNWNFFYSNFLNCMKVSLIVFLDFKYFKSFLNMFLSFKRPISGLIDFNMKSDWFDYPIIVNSNKIYNSFEKLLFFNYINMVYFKGLFFYNNSNKFYFLKHINKLF